MSATCGLDKWHPAHTEFYGWPREQRICDGLPNDTLEYLARVLIVRSRVDVLDDLRAYLEATASEMVDRTEGADGRWAVGYLAALGDVSKHVARLNQV